MLEFTPKDRFLHPALERFSIKASDWMNGHHVMLLTNQLLCSPELKDPRPVCANHDANTDNNTHNNNNNTHNNNNNNNNNTLYL
ncbi:hypothetical protein KUCAC02_016639 [Chaenocephalus aceratus]|nr:hypothetical protein KUCAC02_016639 [Chaenocephalus aceratus]